LKLDYAAELEFVLFPFFFLNKIYLMNATFLSLSEPNFSTHSIKDETIEIYFQKNLSKK
jgi:hypothetical protein